jgi:hypothetical protein
LSEEGTASNSIGIGTAGLHPRAIIRSQLPEQPEDGIEPRVEVRLRRQKALHRSDAVGLWAVLDEGVLRRRVGGDEVMREPLNHLADVADAGNTMARSMVDLTNAPLAKEQSQRRKR